MEQGSRPRSVKIGDDERLGWSSERPRREGGPQRPADISTRNRVLKPSEELLYSPGSLVVVASTAPAEADSFVNRLVQNKGALFSMTKVRKLLEGRVGEAELEARAQELLVNAVAKRLESGETLVVVTDTLDGGGGRLCSGRTRWMRRSASRSSAWRRLSAARGIWCCSSRPGWIWTTRTRPPCPTCAAA